MCRSVLTRTKRFKVLSFCLIFNRSVQVIFGFHVEEYSSAGFLFNFQVSLNIALKGTYRENVYLDLLVHTVTWYFFNRINTDALTSALVNGLFGSLFIKSWNGAKQIMPAVAQDRKVTLMGVRLIEIYPAECLLSPGTSSRCRVARKPMGRTLSRRPSTKEFEPLLCSFTYAFRLCARPFPERFFIFWFRFVRDVY